MIKTDINPKEWINEKIGRKERLKYHIDRFMEKGVISHVLMLFIFIIFGALIIGILASIFGVKGGVIYLTWESLVHILDAGVIGGDHEIDVSYLIFMTIATAFGLIVTSGLIGVFTSAIESYLNKLKNSNSRVLINGHTVIMGFNDHTFSLISELVLANENHTAKHEKRYIVIVDNEDQERMLLMIRERIPDLKGTKIICRSGDLTENTTFEQCSTEKSNSVIINIYDDSEVLKIILAVENYLNTYERITGKTIDTKIIASVTNNYNKSVAILAGQNRCEIISIHDAISRIIAHTCRQPGLSHIFVELFNFWGKELYFEKVAKGTDLEYLVGKTFEDAVLSFRKESAIGIYKNYTLGKEKKTLLNPPYDNVIEDGDMLIMFEEDDGSYSKSEHHLRNVVIPDEISAKVDENKRIVPDKTNLLIIGINRRLEKILSEYDNYMTKGSEVIIVDETVQLVSEWKYSNILITPIVANTSDRNVIDSVLRQYIYINNILVLSSDNVSASESDSKTMMQLLFLRDFAHKTGRDFIITSEMQRYKNQVIASTIHVNDFIVGSRFINLMMTQISENPKLVPIFEELLDTEGAEIYIIKAENYFPLGIELNFFEISKILIRRGIIAIGYQLCESDSQIWYPPKDVKIQIKHGDGIVVISNDYQ